MRENLFNGDVIEINLIVICLFKLSWKYNLNLFTKIGVKIHFPRNFPVFDFVTKLVSGKFLFLLCPGCVSRTLSHRNRFLKWCNWPWNFPEKCFFRAIYIATKISLLNNLKKPYKSLKLDIVVSWLPLTV